jgi:glutaredoxin
MSEIIVYSKPDCPYCVKAKMLLRLRDIPYVESVVGKDILREDFVSLFPDVRSVPLIVIDGVKIGGYDQLVEWFDNRTQLLAG